MCDYSGRFNSIFRVKSIAWIFQKPLSHDFLDHALFSKMPTCDYFSAKFFSVKQFFFYFYQSFIMREGKCIRRTSLLTAVIEDGYHSNFLINHNAVGF